MMEDNFELQVQELQNRLIHLKGKEELGEEDSIDKIEEEMKNYYKKYYEKSYKKYYQDKIDEYKKSSLDDYLSQIHQLKS